MVELFANKNDCCGCSACANICPKNAIMMIKNSEGFLYPQIDEKLCINCGKCKTVCAFQNKGLKEKETKYPLGVYAMKHKSDEVRFNSTSGGAFTAISDYVLEKGGLVYGAAFDDDFNVKHISAYTVLERDAIRGSKYTQSDMTDTFKNIASNLKSGKTVLFTGTPCQCAGLRSFLESQKSDTDNLIACDFVCHGVPSPLLWSEHINSLTKRYGKIDAYSCRSKVDGWHGHTEAIMVNGKLKYKSPFIQKERVLFHSDLMLRYSCYNCKYTNYYRPSDITIADFWGIEKCFPEFDDNKGVSLILVNSEKGEKVFEAIDDSIISISSNKEQCSQPQFFNPIAIPANRDLFWDDYNKKGYKFVIRKYGKAGFLSEVKNAIILFLRKIGIFEILCKILSKD